MSEVVSLRSAAIESDAKAEFIRHISTVFDNYVEHYGVEPEALFHTFCGLRQDASTGWFMRGESETAKTSVHALAVASVLKSIINPEPPFAA